MPKSIKFLPQYLLEMFINVCGLARVRWVGCLGEGVGEKCINIKNYTTYTKLDFKYNKTEFTT